MKTKLVFPLTVAALALGALVFASGFSSGTGDGRVSVPFEISKTGHQTLVVVSGGKRLRLLLDTGSSRNILSADAATRLGLTATGDAGTASGLGFSGHPLRRLDTPLVVDAAGTRFTIGGVCSLDLIFAGDASGEETFDGLLGSPFFRAHRATIDFVARRIVFDSSAV